MSLNLIRNIDCLYYRSLMSRIPGSETMCMRRSMIPVVSAIPHYKANKGIHRSEYTTSVTSSITDYVHENGRRSASDSHGSSLMAYR